MSNQRLVLGATGVNNKVRRVRREAITEALNSKHASPAERRLVEFLADIAGGNPMCFRNGDLLSGARLHYESLRRAVPRAIRDGFIGRDASKRPYTYWIDERWLA